MLAKNRFALAALALSAAFLGGNPAFAGGDCCKEGAGAATADTKKKDPSCWIVACDKKLAKSTEEALAKLAAPAPKRTADEEKAIAAAKRELASLCPFGNAMTRALPPVVEALDAIAALDAVLQAGGKDLPADCKNAEGGCAFCAEVGPKMTEDAKEAMMVTFNSLARANKVARPLAAMAAGYMPATTGEGSTTKPAGLPNKDAFAKLEARLKELMTELQGACKKAEALPAEEKAKIEAAFKKLETLAPEAFPTMWGGYQALFMELDLARKATEESGKQMKSILTDAFTATLSPNAKNAYALFQSRAAVVVALGHVAGATGAVKCGEGDAACGAKAASGEVKKAEGGCCAEQ